MLWSPAEDVTQRQVHGTAGVAALATVLSAALGNPGHVAPATMVPAFHIGFLVAAMMALATSCTARTVRDADAANTMRPRAAMGGE